MSDRQNIARRTFIAASCVLVLNAALTNAVEPGFRRFEHSVSPDGAYILAWGWGENQEHPEQLKEWPSGEDTANDFVANYLVGGMDRRILAIIPERDHFATSDGRWKRFSGLSVSWSADSTRALAIYEGRWSDEAMLWILPKARAFINVGGQLEEAYRSFLRKKIQLEDAGEISFSDAALLPDGVLIIDGRARPKLTEPPEYYYRLRFRVKIENTEAKCTLLGGRKIGEEPAEENEAAADKNMNEAYQRLQAKLDETGRARLKREQLRWLKQRAEMTGTVERWSFTRNRMAHLRARTEN